MKKIAIVLTVLYCGVVAAYAATTFSWSAPQGKGTLTYVNLTLTTPTIAGATMTTAVLTDPQIRDTQDAQSVTGGQAVVLSERITTLTGIGAALNATNTITLTGTAGETYTIISANAATNAIGLGDAAPLYLTAGWNGIDNQVITLYARNTTNFVEVSRANN